MINRKNRLAVREIPCTGDPADDFGVEEAIDPRYRPIDKAIAISTARLVTQAVRDALNCSPGSASHLEIVGMKRCREDVCGFTSGKRAKDGKAGDPS